MIPNVSDFADYQVRSDASLEVDLIGDSINIRMGLVNEYNSRPQEGIEKHDMFFSSSILVSVGD